MLGFLTVALIISHLDRHILSIALQGIKTEFALSDTQLGILSGLPFAVVFVVFGFVSARVARPSIFVRLIVVSLILWSAATLAMGLAWGFATLLVFRIIVGGGEATAIPPSHAMIARAYPQQQRASALAVFQSGAGLGLFLAFVVGGLVVAQFGWRMGFIAAGFLGLLVALPMALWLREPRQPVTAAPETVQRKESEAQVLATIWRNSGTRYVLMGMVLASIVTYGGVAWIPTYLARVQGMPLSQIGLYLAVTVGLVGALGTWLGGALSDRVEARWRGGRLRFVALTVLLAKIGAITFYLLGGSMLALWVFLIPVVLNSIYIAPGMAHIYSTVKEHNRPVAAAIQMFFMHLFGLGLGPMFVGMVSDMAQGAVASPLGLGLGLLQGLGIVSAWCFWKASRAV